MAAVATFLLPGIGNSGPEHWQSHWERDDPSCRRIVQAEWDAPRRNDWVATLDAAIRCAPDDIVLVAHSASCGLVAAWAAVAAPGALTRVRGALLVAPSDPDGPAFPAGPVGFSPMPLGRMPFPTVVVASTDDVYVTIERAQEYAKAWGSRFVNIGAAGHINADSRLGSWPAGRAWLDLLRGN